MRKTWAVKENKDFYVLTISLLISALNPEVYGWYSLAHVRQEQSVKSQKGI